jgi:hypothetical protein
MSAFHILDFNFLLLAILIQVVRACSQSQTVSTTAVKFKTPGSNRHNWMEQIWYQEIVMHTEREKSKVPPTL